MYSGGMMRSKITLIVGLSTVFLFLSIYGTSYVNGQSSTQNSGSVENETGSANPVLQTENLDPFESKGSSSNGIDNSPSQPDADSSTSSNSDDSSTSSNSDDSSTSSNSDDSSTSSNSKNSDDSSNSNKDDKSKEDKSDDDSSPDDIPFP